MNRSAIKKVRLTLGLTQEDFAHRLGVSHCTVSRWENGKASPSRLAKIQIQRLASRNGLKPMVYD